MAKERRILRLQQLILEIVAESVQREVADPRVGLVSITRIKLSPDLSRARVYWSILGDESTIRTTERGLKDALPFIQRSVGQGLKTRLTPHLSLQFDASIEKASRLEEIFHQVHLENRERGLKADGTPRDAVRPTEDDTSSEDGSNEDGEDASNAETGREETTAPAPVPTPEASDTTSPDPDSEPRP